MNNQVGQKNLLNFLRSMTVKSLAFLGTISALSATSVAQAAILWDWSFNGTETVRFTTDGNFADLASANTFNIIDFQVLASIEPSVVGADFINDPATNSQQGFIWNGSQITQVFRGGSNILHFVHYDWQYVFSLSPNRSILGGHFFDPSFIEDAFDPTPSAPTTSGPNPQPAPEPVTIFGLLTFSAVALGSRYQRSK
ncbi:MAG: hypothetical protein F6K17_28100 [Okeania sp. SIO3C4]|nr:hypothetical protein [Okeania sp. SIO3C4]